MHIRRWTFAALLSLAGTALAQPMPRPDASTACAADQADLQKRMADAQAKGRMLLRRELAGQLAALETRCNTLDAGESRTARIARLEKEITALRAELAEAESQLRALKSAAGR